MEIERHDHDVVVIGAGGAGLRAAIAASERGARTALVCKSLLGKAHTVMAEGGIAAALGNVAPDDDWRVHFQDTMFGGKYLNNWRMAELHAKEAPDRVRELEQWGGVFDRTPDRKMSQRAFGGHTLPAARAHRRPHRAGADPDAPGPGRARRHRRLHGVHDHAPAEGRRPRLRARSATGARPASSSSSRARASCSPPAAPASAGRSPRTRGSAPATGTRSPTRRAPSSSTWSSSSSTRPGWSGRPACAGCSSPRRCAARAGSCATRAGERFMERYDPKRLELSTRDVVARAIYTEVEEGRGTPRGGVFLDVSHLRRRRPCAGSCRACTTQFMELAGVDITREPMEVGPTCHYIMGGIRVDAETGASTRRRPVRGGRVRGRHERREPARRQLALRPARVRPARGRRRGPVRAREARALRPHGARGRRAARADRYLSAPATRTPTRCTPSCRRRCRRTSGSSATRPA